MSAIQLTSLFAMLEARDNLTPALDAVEKKTLGLRDTLNNLSSSVSQVGSGMTTLFAPLGLALGASVKGSMDFSTAITNAGAALGMTKEQIADVSAQVLDLGANSRAGAQSAAEAYYDIAGGVADASTHMDVLKTSLDVAAAGSADLGGVVDALVKTMNIYGMSAEEAAGAGDVLTRAVGVGVGTMGEFASALPPVEGLAQSLGISFEDTGGYMAYMSTKAASVAEGGTQLKGVMSKLINPSKELGEAIAAMGYASGASLVEQEGLVGALQKIKDFGGGTFSGLITDQEAMLGAMALTADGAEEFFKNYSNGIDGATQKAKEIQMSSPAAQFDLLKNSMAQLGIEVGNTLVPVLVDLVKSIKPVITSVIGWVKENPELVKQIAMVVGGLAIAGPVLLAVGAGMSAIGAIFAGVAGVIGVVLSPIGLVIAGVVALGAAFATNFGGIRDLLQPVVDQVVGGVRTLIGVIGNFSNIVENKGIGDAIGYVINAFAQMIGLVPTDDLLPGVLDFGNGIVTTFSNIANFVTGTVIPTLQTLANWFLTDVLPVVVGFVRDTVIPGIQSFFTMLGNAWAVVGPALGNLFNWFVNEGLPAVVGFVTGTVIPAVQDLFNFIAGVWEQVRPALESFFNWFFNEGLPSIVGFVRDTVLPAIQDFFNFIGGVWEQVRPALESVFNWFVNEGMPAISNFITQTVQPAIESLFNFISGAWDLISPVLSDIFEWFVNTGLPKVQEGVETISTKIGEFVTTLQNIWAAVQGPLNSLRDGIVGILKPVLDTIGQVISGFNSMAGFGEIQSQAQTATSGLSNDQLWQATLNAAGGNDLMARIAFAGARAEGGDVQANKAYLVGEKGPEIFNPNSNGTIIPNKSLQSGMGGLQVGTVVVNANSQAEGAAAADGFMGRMDELIRMSGMGGMG